MTELLLALGFLTRLPLPAVDASEAAFARSIRWFPAAGLAVGAVAAVAGWLGGRIDPWVGALAATAAWVAVTGGLHLDGLADLADARGAAHGDRSRFLAVLADPHIGSFGVIAVALQLAAKLVLVHAIGGAWLALLLIPGAARLGPLAWARWLRPLHDGLGARFGQVVRRVDLVAWASALALASLSVPALAMAPVAVALWWWWLRRVVGGVSGDCHGAGIELVETALLLASAAIGAR
jgi:adenosylcobinamide-GDP ribazoletransferase